MRNTFLLFSTLGVALAMLGGCSPGTPNLSEEQAKHFKGSPMPPGTWEKIAATQKEWAKTHPPTGGAVAQSGAPAGPSVTH